MNLTWVNEILLLLFVWVVLCWIIDINEIYAVFFLLSPPLILPRWFRTIPAGFFLVDIK